MNTPRRDWIDEVAVEIIAKYGFNLGGRLVSLIIRLREEGEIFSVNQLTGNLLDRDYKKDYE